ncbi:hypothetical protein ERJ75_000823800 [Trypanosoma vivax]|uniref:Uncharacterized protein n=1 Tax=Trypanosoma vivax (strain Y486) TaxID=1055687 RepID=G0UBG5_TRYVY|nr:hypothetical protein TRVL_01976 [Trypanosoma vivax]KAH8613109.1 hypothetical protein ERJ75_000823800 [Trypanosoma vivax]CCC53161.1 conserved hypothetical protein [Trypanosoma vivax Y486]
MDKECDVETLSLPELNAKIERCERLLQHPALLGRLPDGGEGIRSRHALYVSEKAKRVEEAPRADAIPTTEEIPSPGSYEEAARAVGERHRDFRVPVEEVVRRTFGGSLCESEIQRILSDVPPNFFLTYGETLQMEQRIMAQEREATLERLRRQSAEPNT